MQCEEIHLIERQQPNKYLKVLNGSLCKKILSPAALYLFNIERKYFWVRKDLVRSTYRPELGGTLLVSISSILGRY